MLLNAEISLNVSVNIFPTEHLNQIEVEMNCFRKLLNIPEAPFLVFYNVIKAAMKNTGISKYNSINLTLFTNLPL